MAWRPLVIAALVAASLAPVALAASVNGTSGPDRLDGTRHDDRIRGRGGDDELAGGRGDDRLAGGPGHDVLAGGRGEDRCLTDAADAAPTGCEIVQGPAGPLTIDSTTGTDRCIILRGLYEGCYFILEGGGADEAGGTVSGEGGVRPTSPDDFALRDGRWTARGVYSCDADGAFVVTIGAESVRAPVTCRFGYKRAESRSLSSMKGIDRQLDKRLPSAYARPSQVQEQ